MPVKSNLRGRWILVGLAVLVALLILGMVVVGRTGNRLDPRLNGEAPQGAVTVGAYGPLQLTFAEPIQPASLDAAFRVDPPVAGRFSWTGEAVQSFSFWPEKPLTPGQPYTLRLQSGLASNRGTILRQAKSWQVEVRQPELLYLAPSQAPELWQVGADGLNPRQITSTAGKVYDYAPAPDGSRILFSARNEQGGLDLWELQRGADKAVLLLPCGPDWCFEAAYAPDLQKIAYTRRTFSGLKGAMPGIPRLWIFDRAANSTDALLKDPLLGGTAAAWPPDGRYLAFTDPQSAVVRVVDFQEKTDFSIPAGEESRVAWAPAGLSLWMTRPESSQEFPYVSIYQVDVAARQAQMWSAEKGPLQADYSLPMPSPDGVWLAVSRRQIGDGTGKQLWLMQVDGSQPQAVTQDPLANFAGYQWDPTSQRLVFQRLSLSGSASQPQVMLWDRQSNQQVIIAEDAFQPRWLP